MVKKLKRFIVFCLFSLFFALLSGKVQKGENNKNGNKNEKTWNSADALIEITDPSQITGPDGSNVCY